MVTVNSGANIKLSGNVSFTMGDGDTLLLMYVTGLGGGDRWVEITRSDN